MLCNFSLVAACTESMVLTAAAGSICTFPEIFSVVVALAMSMTSTTLACATCTAHHTLGRYHSHISSYIVNRSGRYYMYSFVDLHGRLYIYICSHFQLVPSLQYICPQLAM